MTPDPTPPAAAAEAPISRREVLTAISSVWWLLLLRGVLLIVLGGYALLTPGLTLEAYSWVLGVFVLADGVLALVAAVMGWGESRGWTLLRGVLGVIAGLVIVANPALFGIVTIWILVTILAVQMIIGGGLEIYVAIKERKEIEGEGWMILAGVFSILFGLLVLAAPLLAGRTLIQVIGAFAIIFGISLCVTAFRIKGLRGRLEADQP
ncbi:acid-resistance membrane protein [Posidoniimonas polymericola]|uniref:Acid-resistance membrane protein n=1 Tax=Posidoniimonas polymericola TaxID=2528002 RepID=A0A5C5YRT7_9BACT|nr:DUF308 domain-containing protein [Posidoniimonas polymericola]TWT77661.1 acid-resistance membrane protein [Posidoniimonas polymericola]